MRGADRRASGGALVAAVLLWGGEASAQEAPRYRLALPLFETSLPGGRFFSVNTSEVRLGKSSRGGAQASPLDVVVSGAGATVEVSSGLLSVKSSLTGVEQEVIRSRTTVHLDALLARWHRFAAAVSVPLLLQQGSDAQALARLGVAAPGVLGDVRLSLRAVLVGEAQGPLAMAFQVDSRLPTGGAEGLNGDGAARVHPRFIASGKVGPAAYAVNVGLLLRDDRSYGDVAVGDAASFGAAAAYAVPIREATRRLNHLQFSGEFIGHTAPLGGGELLARRSMPLEALFGARLVEETPGNNHLAAGLAVGSGLTRAPGVPDYRVLASIVFAAGDDPLPADEDGDRIEDHSDACPDRRGPPSSDPGLHGCPPRPDLDGDSIEDDSDACVDRPGVRSSDRRQNGCPPPPPDRDRDGIPDPGDACPGEPGLPSPDPSRNGCPPRDADGDAVPDEADACPQVPGPASDEPSRSGCPDTDGDGIVDPRDACPSEPGPEDADPARRGCPVVRLEQREIKITEQVQFALNQAVILPASGELLRKVAELLRQHPEVQEVSIEGHTDDRGTPQANLLLSKQRAEAVKRWLVAREGLAAGRLTTQGFGASRPLAGPDDPRNRRVEFRITRQATRP